MSLANSVDILLQYLESIRFPLQIFSMLVSIHISTVDTVEFYVSFFRFLDVLFIYPYTRWALLYRIDIWNYQINIEYL